MNMEEMKLCGSNIRLGRINDIMIGLQYYMISRAIRCGSDFVSVRILSGLLEVLLPGLYDCACGC